MTGKENEVLFDVTMQDDEFIAFMQRFDANMDRMANAAEEGFADVDKALDRTGKKMGLVAGIVGGVTAQLVQMGLQAVGAIQQFVKGSIDLTARVDTLGTSLALVAKNAGYSSEEMRETEEEVKGLGITTSSARESMIRLTRANIDWSEASKLARIAQNSAVVAGINSSQAFERMVLGIQKQEPELLDELGITLNRADAYERMANTIGKTTKALTDAEKQQAILNDIYRQSETVAGAYEEAMGTVGKQVTSLPRLFEELQLTIGRAFQPAYTILIEFMSEKLKELQKWFDENQDTIERFAENLGKFLKNLFIIIEEVVGWILKIPKVLWDIAESIAGAVRDIEEGTDDVVDANRELDASMKETKKSGDNLATTIDKLVTIINSKFAGAAGSFVERVQLMGKGIDLLWKKIFDPSAVKEAQRQYDEALASFGTLAKEWEEAAFKEGAEFQDLTEFTDDTDESKKAIEEWDAAVVEATDDAESMADAVNEIDDAFKELKEDLEEQAALKVIKETRAQIERDLRDSFRREDIERNFEERILQIQVDAGDKSLANFEDWQEARTQAALSNSKRLIKIEEAYRERLKEIEKDFIAEASELARKRDAVGLLALERKKDRELEKVEEQRAKEKESQESSYAEQLANLKAQYDKFEDELIISTQEQFDRAEDARTKEYESLARSLDRERQIRELHAQWQIEDEERALEKKLTKMGESFAAIEGLTTNHLANLLKQYEEFNTSAVMSGFLSMTGGMPVGRGRGPVTRSTGREPTRGGGGGRPQGGGTPVASGGGGSAPGTIPTSQAATEQGQWPSHTQAAPKLADWVLNAPLASLRELLRRLGMQPNLISQFASEQQIHDYLLKKVALYRPRMPGVYGQAGQVSALLAGALSGGQPTLATQQPARLPLAPASTSTNRREIHVTADLGGVDAHTQRMVLNTMLEIERNRSG